MRRRFLAALLINSLAAFTSNAHNTAVVDPLIERCIEAGSTHQVCACTSLKLRREIGAQNYSELLGVVAQMVALKARGLSAPVTDPQAGMGEYQYLEGVAGMLTRRDNSRGLAYRANHDLCMALSQN